MSSVQSPSSVYSSDRASDVFNGSASRDFCNSFWGGDDGVNILFARMRGAAKTANELKSFWSTRAAIEEEYAKKLLDLGRASLGQDEIGDVRTILDTVKLETEKMAQAHIDLTQQIRKELEAPCIDLQHRYAEHKHHLQQPLEKKFKLKQMQESYVAKAREKYASDCLRIASYSKQFESAGRDQDRLQQKLARARQTVAANEKDYRNFIEKLRDMERDWEADWREFCDDSQDLEEERLDFMKDNLWTYANEVSTVCVADDLSCEAIRTVLDTFEAEKHLEGFANQFGSGNTIRSTPAFDDQTDPNTEPTFTLEVARFPRNRKARDERRPIFTPLEEESDSMLPPPAPPPAVTPTPPPPPIQSPPLETYLAAAEPPRAISRTASVRRISMPLPEQPVLAGRDPAPSPRPPEHLGGEIMFYVKALYDYTATIDEEFDFQAGDVIAVTATPEDGWWSGELLDEQRREAGRHIFPSNFVTLF